MELILAGIYVAAAWYFLNFFQRSMGIVFFGRISDYFLYKLIISMFLGWLIIPIGLICLVFKKIFSRKNK